MTWYRQRTENSGQRLLGLAVSTAHAAFYVKELFKATDTVVAPGWQNRDSHCKCLFSYFTGFSIQINYASFIIHIKLNLTAPVCVTAPRLSAGLHVVKYHR